MAYHAEQQKFLHSTARFISLPKGRRSGGTELSKRKLCYRAGIGSDYPTPKYFCGAPTHAQAKKIFWGDLKAMFPKRFIRRVSESDKYIELVTGAQIWVMGLDKPERIEGTPWDGCIITEFANVKKGAWQENIRPALSDRGGWAVLESAPEGRNHFYEIDRAAREEMRTLGDQASWAAFHWRSESVFPLYGIGHEIDEAKRDLDEKTYEQEYGASFVNFSGVAYYTFQEALHCQPLAYNPLKPLIFCFDFNVTPGVAAVCQEQMLPPPAGQMGTGVIGEVWIESDSNTLRVCDALYEDWKDHLGPILCYGDASGGARATSQTQGTDWDLIKEKLTKSFGRKVGFRVPRANPAVRTRVNAVNSRFMSVAGGIKMMVDPLKAPHVVLDMEGVMRGPTGDIDKSKHKEDGRTHIGDALGYYIVHRFPVSGDRTAAMEISELFGTAA